MINITVSMYSNKHSICTFSHSYFFVKSIFIFMWSGRDHLDAANCCRIIIQLAEKMNGLLIMLMYI